MNGLNPHIPPAVRASPSIASVGLGRGLERLVQDRTESDLNSDRLSSESSLLTLPWEGPWGSAEGGLGTGEQQRGPAHGEPCPSGCGIWTLSQGHE